MRVIYICLAILCATLCTQFAYSAEPRVTENVVVMTNTTANQCPSHWRGNGGSGILNSTGGYGQSNGAVGLGVTSCTGCAYNSQNQSCVCKRCYDYFDN